MTFLARISVQKGISAQTKQEGRCERPSCSSVTLAGLYSRGSATF